jgi:hypothetical protein
MTKEISLTYIKICNNNLTFMSAANEAQDQLGTQSRKECVREVYGE